MSMKELAMTLLQSTYYDGVDEGNMEKAASALHEDVEWSHAQVWGHHEFRPGEASANRGKAEVQAFLQARVKQLAEARIRHKVRDMVIEGNKGAILGYVRGEDGTEKQFMVWFEIRDDKISRYLLRPL
ncbi:MAG: nuclear transport factor 2 family protein [Sphingomonadales bacterium]